MPILTVDGMASVEKTKSERAEAIKTLTSKPFNINDEEQLASLRRYINQFELNANQMYLFQGLSNGLTVWAGSWAVGYFLPIPAFINYFLSMFLYAGAAGHILQNFSILDFHTQLEELKTIYNWCLKKGQANYDGSTDNTVILSKPDIQRLIKLLAPLCSTEFILTWKKVISQESSQSGVMSYLTSTYNFFTSPKPNIDLTRLQDLQASVERRELDVNVFKGVQKALEYFITNPHFREMLTTKIKQPIESVKGMLPSIVTEAISSYKKMS